jgi:crossover junction endodeoxyribonuclease RuvC
MRVLGLDPGTARTGYGCVELEDDRPVRVASGVLQLGRGTLPERLALLYSGLDRLFELHHPEACATEGLFHHRNARSALLLGHARGVCLLVAARHGIDVAEYAPATVKRALAGHGAADKERVATMVSSVLRFEPASFHDETDALAIALCHLEAHRPLRFIEE